jgi:aconitate hydratase 2/2-methylisocitrate dehydratase
LADVSVINKDSANVYKYMNFDKMEEFQAAADTVKAEAA